MGRPEADFARKMAMTVAWGRFIRWKYDEDALSVHEAQLSMMRRLGAQESNILMAEQQSCELV